MTRPCHILKSPIAACVLIAAFVAGHASSALAERYALLVGVSEYPTLNKDLQLNGPKNDVPAIRTLLEQRGFAAVNIDVLADGVKDAAMPTRAAIMTALDRVVSRAASGDYVYLHFAGHGSQQPARDPKLKPDGLSEIFLPRDVGKWENGISSVHNAIADEELVQRLDALLAKGAFVWAVFDACHSATLMRGAKPVGDAVRYRQIEPADLGVPKTAMDLAAAHAPRTRGAPEAKEPLAGTGAKAPGRFVAFYAAQTTERTPEMNLPAGHPDRKPMGLFSFTIAETVASLPDGVTYRQLAQQVLNRYAAQNFDSPTPLFTGSLDTPVFGSQPGPRVQQWRLRGNLRIDAGALNGLSDATVVAIVPGPLSKNEEVIGYARLANVEVFGARLEPFEKSGKPALGPEKIPPGAFARLTEPTVDFSLSVAGPLTLKGAAATDPAAQKAVAALRAEKAMRVQWVDAARQPDLRLVVDAGRLWLVPRGAALIPEGPLKTHSIALAQDEAQLRLKLAESLRVISKVSALMRLSGAIAGGPASQNLEVSLELARGEAKRRLSRESLPVLLNGDVLGAEVRNKGRAPIDVTILHVDSEYGISAVFPQMGGSNRIEPGAKLSIALGVVDDKTIGTERLLIIAVEARRNDESYDFSFLAQAGIERTRGGPEDEIMGAFMDAGYRATTRALNQALPGRTAMQMFAWRVEKPEVPKR